MTFPEDPTESVVKSVGFTNYTKEITIELENRDVIHLHAAADCCSESFFVIIDNPDKLVGCKLLYLMETTPKESGQDVSGYGGTPVGITDYTVDTTGLSNRNNDCSKKLNYVIELDNDNTFEFGLLHMSNGYYSAWIEAYTKLA